MCELCGWNSEKFKSWYDHSTYFHGDRPHQCEECGKQFSRLSVLAAHRYNKHTVKKCDQCDEVFICGRQFSGHRLSAHNYKQGMDDK